MWLRIENFNMYNGVSPKNLIFRGEGATKNQYIQGELPQKGGFGHFANLWRDTSKRGGGVFEEEGEFKGSYPNEDYVIFC